MSETSLLITYATHGLCNKDTSLPVGTRGLRVHHFTYGRRKSLLGHVSSKTIWQRFTFVHIILHVQRKKKLLSPWPWFVFIVQCVHV